MENLTLEEKVGQVFMFGFPKNNPGKALDLIKTFKPGGIIYFARNCDSIEKTSILSAELQNWANDYGSGIPLFIAADQEGGIVTRLSQNLAVMPGPMSLSAAVSGENSTYITNASRATAIQLRSAGINMNLAPVLDVNNNPHNPVIGVRSFGDDPNIVSKYGTAAVKGLEQGGIISVGKHFPGHGNTSIDSHLDLPVLPFSMENLNSCELIPFRSSINCGIPAIMSAHIIFQAVDRQNPATLSRKVLKDLLRNTLGFKGVIITDCLEMNAIAKHPGTAQGAVEAFKAGCDILLISHTKSLQKEAWFRLLKAVRSGHISENRLNESVNRIIRLKQLFKLPNCLPTQMAYNPDFKKLSQELHLRSTTIVKNEMQLVPLPVAENRKFKICIISSITKTPLLVQDPLIENTESPDSCVQTPLGKFLNKLCKNLEINEVGMGYPKALKKSLTLATNSNITIVLTQNAANNPGQSQFVRNILDKVPNTIVVATGEPYDIAIAPDNIHTYLCTYSNHPEAMRALAYVLMGRFIASGRLPVTIANKI